MILTCFRNNSLQIENSWSRKSLYVYRIDKVEHDKTNMNQNESYIVPLIHILRTIRNILVQDSKCAHLFVYHFDKKPFRKTTNK